MEVWPSCFLLHRLQCLESCEALSGKARKVIAAIAHKLVVGKESPLRDQVAIIDALTEPAKITKAVCWRLQIFLRVSCQLTQVTLHEMVPFKIWVVPKLGSHLGTP